MFKLMDKKIMTLLRKKLLNSPYGSFINFACSFFSKSTFTKKSFTNSIRVSNSLDPDQAQHFVEPDLGPNCLLRLSAEDASRLLGKELTSSLYTIQIHICSN